MKVVALIALLCLGVVAQTFYSYKAAVCGNFNVSSLGIPEAVEMVKKQGCSQAVVQQVADNGYLVYGIKLQKSIY